MLLPAYLLNGSDPNWEQKDRAAASVFQKPNGVDTQRGAETQRGANSSNGSNSSAIVCLCVCFTYIYELELIVVWLRLALNP